MFHFGILLLLEIDVTFILVHHMQYTTSMENSECANESTDRLNLFLFLSDRNTSF